MHTEPAGARRSIARALAAAWAAAGIALLGAALLWLRPWNPVRVDPGGGAVIGAPGASFPKTAGAPGQGSAGGTFRAAPAPAFALTVLSAGAAPAPAPRIAIPPAGGRLALAALRGHPVVINFWASWCAPCRAEMPMLVRASHAYAARGVVVLGLDVHDTPADARRFLTDYHVDYPVVTVPDDRLPRAYGVIGLPTTVFVDADGMMRGRRIGQFDGAAGEQALKHNIDALIAGASR